MTSAKAISPQNAQRLALWLAHEQPQLFAVIHAKVTAMRAAGQLSGACALQGLGCACAKPARKIGTFGRLGQTGITSWDDSIGSTFPSGSTSAFDIGTTALPGTTGITSWDDSIGAGGTYPQGGTFTGSTGALAPIGTTAASQVGSTALTTPIVSSGSTGFWSSFSSDVGSLGASVAPAIADVAMALTSGSTLAAVAGAVSQYYASQPSSTAAQLAATQVARTAAGESPAAIAGGTLYTQTGATAPVTSSLLSDLTPSEESLLIPILLIGAIALVLLA